ncbi:MAG: hypothetical protein IKS96_04720 [Fibrobacter sp.]|nr:hypothetical protein [Fibrobacter sp.]
MNKFLDKVLTLAAFVSVTSLSVHYAPLYLWELKQINDPPTFFIILQILFFLIMSSASILLFLELFSVKIKPVRNNVWTIFAIVGIAPIMPYACFGALILVVFVIAKIGEFLGFC